MRTALHTTKITDEAMRLLALISAITREKRYEVQERLFRQELERLAPEMVRREDEERLLAERALDPWETQEREYQKEA